MSTHRVFSCPQQNRDGGVVLRRETSAGSLDSDDARDAEPHPVSKRHSRRSLVAEEIFREEREEEINAGRLASHGQKTGSKVSILLPGRERAVQPGRQSSSEGLGEHAPKAMDKSARPTSMVDLVAPVMRNPAVPPAPPSDGLRLPHRAPANIVARVDKETGSLTRKLSLSSETPLDMVKIRAQARQRRLREESTDDSAGRAMYADPEYHPTESSSDIHTVMSAHGPGQEQSRLSRIEERSKRIQNMSKVSRVH